MAHKIRQFMADMDIGMLFGEVEIDESYIGGHRPGKTGRGAGGKDHRARHEAAGHRRQGVRDPRTPRPRRSSR